MIIACSNVTHEPIIPCTIPIKHVNKTKSKKKKKRKLKGWPGMTPPPAQSSPPPACTLPSPATDLHKP